MLCFKDRSFCSKSHKCARKWCSRNVEGESGYKTNTLPICYINYDNYCGRFVEENPISTKYPFADMVPGDRISYSEQDGFNIGAVKRAFNRHLKSKKTPYRFFVRTGKTKSGKIVEFYCIDEQADCS